MFLKLLGFLVIALLSGFLYGLTIDFHKFRTHQANIGSKNTLVQDLKNYFSGQ